MAGLVNAALAAHKVVIFSKTYCPFCSKVKDLFKSIGESYHALELDLRGEEGVTIQSALTEITGQKTVPNVFVNGRHIGGCDSTLKAYKDGILTQLLKSSRSTFDFDLIVIGGGSGGLSASKEAASLGKRVAVVDFVKPSPIGTKWGLGGTCVNVGCIPKKLMHRAALMGCDVKDAPSFGWEIPENVSHTWTKMVEEVQNHIKSLNFGYKKSLRENSVKYINAFAKLLPPFENTIQVTDKNKDVRAISAEHFIVAVGGRPRYPEIPGAIEYGITSDDLFSLPYPPGKTLIVGASYIALECAGFLRGLGFEVTVMVRSIFLRGFDQQMAEMIAAQMTAHGVDFIRECVPLKIEKIEDGSPGKLLVTGLLNSGGQHTSEYNTVIFAVGRKACTEELGLRDIGVRLNESNDKVLCNEADQSSIPNVFAIGDISDGKPELTPVAIQAGRLLAQRLYAGKSTLMDYTNVPTCVFTPLEYGCVGLSEEDAIKKYGEDNLMVYHTHFAPLENVLSGRDGNTPYGKLICLNSEEEKVVGLHYLGPNAGEIVQGFSIGLKLGAKKSDFDNLVGIHPTCAEIFTTMYISKASGVSVEKSSC